MPTFHSATTYYPKAANDAGKTARDRDIALYRARRIEQRFIDHPELEQYRDLIFYDWPEGDDHLDWIASADIAEILAWAEAIRAQEAE